MFHDLTLSPSEQWLVCLLTGATVGLHSRSRVRGFATQHVLAESVVSVQPVRQAWKPRKVSLFGMSIDGVDMAAAVDTVSKWCNEERNGRCKYVVTPNVDHTVMFQTNCGVAQRLS